MLNQPDPANYEAWYHSERGAWIGETEFRLLMKLLMPVQGGTLLDVGCGTGYFTRCFAAQGFDVIALDTDDSMLRYAYTLDDDIRYLQGDAAKLPFDEHSVDYCAAVTSLCFVDDPKIAIQEMLRISRCGVVIGLLNRESRLYKEKYGRGTYQGARWDSLHDVKNWISEISADIEVDYGTAVFFPNASKLARIAERLLSSRFKWGSFLAVCLRLRD